MLSRAIFLLRSNNFSLLRSANIDKYSLGPALYEKILVYRLVPLSSSGPANCGVILGRGHLYQHYIDEQHLVRKLGGGGGSGKTTCLRRPVTRPIQSEAQLIQTLWT